jgi:hypothetical protein
MIRGDQVIINPSSTTILSHITLHVFYRLILEKLSSYYQVAFKNIQCLEIALDQFFLDLDQVTSDEPS